MSNNKSHNRTLGCNYCGQTWVYSLEPWQCPSNVASNCPNCSRSLPWLTCSWTVQFVYAPGSLALDTWEKPPNTALIGGNYKKLELNKVTWFLEVNACASSLGSPSLEIFFLLTQNVWDSGERSWAERKRPRREINHFRLLRIVG